MTAQANSSRHGAVRAVAVALAAFFAVLALELPAGATPARAITRAHLRCAHGHTVHVVESYTLASGHPELLTVTEHYDGLTLYIGRHEHVSVGSPYASDNLVGEHQVAGLVVHWIVHGHTTSERLAPISC